MVTGSCNSFQDPHADGNESLCLSFLECSGGW